jgi:hypothetical protein
MSIAGRRMACEYFGVPIEPEKIGRANIKSARDAWRAFYSASASSLSPSCSFSTDSGRHGRCL